MARFFKKGGKTRPITSRKGSVRGDSVSENAARKNLLTLKEGTVKTIRDLQAPGYLLAQTDHDIESIRDDVGRKADDFGAFIVKLGDGHYKEVWGIRAAHAPLDSSAELIYTE